MAAWIWTNNLNEKSEEFFTPKKLGKEKEIDLSAYQIGKVYCKTAGGEAD